MSGSRKKIEKASNDLLSNLRAHVDRGDGLCIIKAPPGSGKTYTLMHAVVHAVNRGERVAVAAQTNAQSNDICQRLVQNHPGFDVYRYAANGSAAPNELDIPEIHWVSREDDLTTEPSCTVATTAKWSLISLATHFDILFVDEAWQMAWADFMLLQQVSPRFVLIGDPGQIPPVVTISTHRWETSPRAPHLAAPQLLLEDPTVEKLALDLPACRRLPADSVELVRPFYDFHFDAWAKPEDRFVRVGKAKGASNVDSVLNLLGSGSSAIATLPTPDSGPSLEEDKEIAKLAVEIVTRILDRGASVSGGDDGAGSDLQPTDIGICATHRVMNSAIMRGLPSDLNDSETGVRVDTPERWQGLERKLMIVLHPLSGVLQPSVFDLETGRLCVMASRHRAGLIVLSRDHVCETLDSYIPSADQALGRPDVTGRGHFQNQRFWNVLRNAQRIANLQ